MSGKMEKPTMANDQTTKVEHSSGCVFYDLNVACENLECTVCKATIAAEVEQCATCRYWHRDEAGYVFGMCRRWPPRAGLTVHAAKAHSYDRIEVTMQTSAAPEWPNTGKDDGCGEHQARSAERHG